MLVHKYNRSSELNSHSSESIAVNDLSSWLIFLTQTTDIIIDLDMILSRYIFDFTHGGCEKIFYTFNEKF